MISSNFISNSLIFVFSLIFQFFWTKLLKLVFYFFSTAVRAVVVAKLVILGISFLTSIIFALRIVLVLNFVI